jgi:hypothetical protein
MRSQTDPLASISRWRGGRICGASLRTADVSLYFRRAPIASSDIENGRQRSRQIRSTCLLPSWRLRSCQACSNDVAASNL